MKLSLAVKITGIVSIPVAALVCSSLVLSHNYSAQLESAIVSNSNLDTLELTSNLVQELQFERTASILNGMGLVSTQDLVHQRKAVDESLVKFGGIPSEPSTHSAIYGKILDTVHQNFDNLTFIRSNVNNNGSVQDILRSFNLIADTLFSLENNVTESELTPIVRRRTLGVIHLEAAKEKLTRLSPSLIWVLHTNKPIEDTMLFSLIELMGNTISYLHSPAVVALAEANTQIQILDSAPYWQKFDLAFKDVVKNARTGSFSSDAKVVSSSSRQIVTDLKALIDRETESLRNDIHERRSEAFASLWLTRSSLLFVLLALGVLCWFTIRAITRPINQVISPLGESAVEVEWAAQELQTSSSQLSQEATEAAASLQEIASALDQLSSMVAVNTQNSTKCTEVASISHTSATRGKHTVEEMIQAIQDIDASNELLLKQVNESNEHLLEITKVIREIGNKTKVINEIVFQTKLLSFNASVEAARAGEHGRGFAVVAEEVGNLAQMSGNASKEIAEMLEGSIRQVDQIIKETRTKVENLVAIGKEKVQSGTQVSNQCGVILDEIVKNFSLVNEMISHISTASKEQSQGLSEITKSISQLDQVTHHNSNAAVELTSTAHEFLSQAKKIHGFVQILFQTIRGHTPQSSETASGPISISDASVRKSDDPLAQDKAS